MVEKRLTVAACTAAAAVSACGPGGASDSKPVASMPAVAAAAGGSKAVCSPSPCRPGAQVGYAVFVDDGAGKRVRRKFSVIRPLGLRNSASNRAPLVVAINNSGWRNVAARNRFVVAVIPNDVHCVPGKQCQYQGRATNPDPSSIGTRDCGPSGRAPCDDAPWIKGVLDAVECSGPPPCQNIDTTRVFASGSSKGAMMVNDLMCDRRTSARFSGYQAISIQLISPSKRNRQKVLPRCAGVLHDRPNIDFSAQWMFGDRDPVFASFCRAHVSCLETGWTDVRNRWNFGMAQLAGDARFGRRVFGAGMGCTAKPATSTVRPGLVRKVYGSCSVRGAATSTFKVVGGGHGYPGLQGVNGFDPNAESWSFWSSHPGSGARRTARDTAPPSVIVSRRRARKRRIAGRALDPSGVASVTVSLRGLRSGSHPIRLRARLARHGRWSYTVPRGVTVPAGRYRVRVSGKDRAGNRGNLAPARKRVVTLRLR